MDEQFLAHYGVLGMKWGVRRNPERAYDKAKTKAVKLRNKSDKLNYRLSKTNRKLDKVSRKENQYQGEDNNPYTSTREKLESKSENLASRSRTASEKHTKWADRMDKTFGKLNIDDLPESDIEAGKEYVNYILALQSSQVSDRYLRAIR